MANASVEPSTSNPESPGVAELIQGIGHDVRTIAVDEIQLARGKLVDFLETALFKASIALVGAFIAVIGLAMLCVVVVIALEPVIPTLWLRLLIMSLVYLAIGGGGTYLYTKRMLAARAAELDNPIAAVADTVNAVTRGLEH